MAEGAAVIDIRVRAMMEGQVSQRLKDVETAAKSADAATRNLGNAAKSTESDFKKFGHTVQEEVFELNSRKAKRFVDMFLGGGLFSIGMTLASKAVESLGEAIRTHFEESAKTATDRVNDLLAKINEADKKLSSIGADEFYKQAQLNTRQAEEALELKERELAAMEQAKTASAVEHERLMGEVSSLRSKLLTAQHEESAAQKMSLEIERSTMIEVTNRTEARKKEIEVIKNRMALLDDQSVRGGQLAGPMGFRGHEGLTPEQQFGDYGQYEQFFQNVVTLEEAFGEQLLATAANTAAQFVGIWGDAFGQMVVSGNASWGEVAKSMLGAVGSMAMQLGQFLILWGTGLNFVPGGSAFSPGAIAAGAGLVLLGGVLKALAGKQSAAPTAAASGGSYASSYSPRSGFGGGLGGGQGGNQTIIVNIGGQALSDEASIGRSVMRAVNTAYRQGYGELAPQW